jgi:serine/threonine protein kinase
MMWSGNAKCWKRECEVLAKIQHPSCVAFYGCSESNDCLVIVQGLYAGGDLRRAILDHPEAALRRNQDFLLEIAGALEHLHSNNIVHRDLKPENVLLTKTDVECSSLKVYDFGLSKISEYSTARNATCALRPCCIPKFCSRTARL